MEGGGFSGRCSWALSTNSDHSSRGLSCSAACGILSWDQTLPPALASGFFTPSQQEARCSFHITRGRAGCSEDTAVPLLTAPQGPQTSDRWESPQGRASDSRLPFTGAGRELFMGCFLHRKLSQGAANQLLPPAPGQGCSGTIRF